VRLPGRPMLARITFSCCFSLLFLIAAGTRLISLAEMW
jgi:hypothetical protein